MCPWNPRCDREKESKREAVKRKIILVEAVAQDKGEAKSERVAMRLEEKCKAMLKREKTELMAVANEEKVKEKAELMAMAKKRRRCG